MTFVAVFGEAEAEADVEADAEGEVEVDGAAASGRAPELIVGRGAVAFRQVDFRYDPRRPILSNVDFQVPP